MQRDQFINCTVFMALLISSNAYSADQLQVKLDTQIELLPACMINDQHYDDGTSGLKFGVLNFGEATATHNGVIDTALSGGVNSAIKIQCNGSSTINIKFGSGKNDAQVPNEVKANYYRAMSNGTNYVGYNLLYGTNKQVLKPEHVISLSNNGQAHHLELYGQAILKGQTITLGTYSDIIPITIEF
ncbi:spore coat protein U-like protein [Acinetobacter calcoaceticus]|uniref:Spore coat protein U-like protein n=1 Tax=Acinetobacter calcoaceticus TaxID=471 RepID=A0A4R1XKG3_ACICA|nr:spore coat protein U-like protein [Acinetobacter calcoaceticus]